MPFANRKPRQSARVQYVDVWRTVRVDKRNKCQTFRYDLKGSRELFTRFSFTFKFSPSLYQTRPRGQRWCLSCVIRLPSSDCREKPLIINPQKQASTSEPGRVLGSSFPKPIFSVFSQKHGFFYNYVFYFNTFCYFGTLNKFFFACRDDCYRRDLLLNLTLCRVQYRNYNNAP